MVGGFPRTFWTGSWAQETLREGPPRAVYDFMCKRLGVKPGVRPGIGLGFKPGAMLCANGGVKLGVRLGVKLGCKPGVSQVLTQPKWDHASGWGPTAFCAGAQSDPNIAAACRAPPNVDLGVPKGKTKMSLQPSVIPLMWPLGLEKTPKCPCSLPCP